MHERLITTLTLGILIGTGVGGGGGSDVFDETSLAREEVGPHCYMYAMQRHKSCNKMNLERTSLLARVLFAVTIPSMNRAE